MTDAPPPKKDPKDYRFQPGNPGKPKGVRHKLKETFFKALTTDFEENGATAIAAARQENPVGYLRVIASVIPQQIDVKHAGRSLKDVPDDELIAALRSGPGADEAEEYSAQPGSLVN